MILSGLTVEIFAKTRPFWCAPFQVLVFLPRLLNLPVKTNPEKMITLLSEWINLVRLARGQKGKLCNKNNFCVHVLNTFLLTMPFQYTKCKPDDMS